MRSSGPAEACTIDTLSSVRVMGSKILLELSALKDGSGLYLQ
jgi:hypothetical protein